MTSIEDFIVCFKLLPIFPKDWIKSKWILDVFISKSSDVYKCRKFIGLLILKYSNLLAHHRVLWNKDWWVTRESYVILSLDFFFETIFFHFLSLIQYVDLLIQLMISLSCRLKLYLRFGNKVKYFINVLLVYSGDPKTDPLNIGGRFHKSWAQGTNHRDSFIQWFLIDVTT